MWTTYRPQKGQSIDLYYLNLDNTNQRHAAGQSQQAPTDVQHVRHAATPATTKQLAVGRRGRRPVRRAIGKQTCSLAPVTDGGGYNFKCRRWNPTFWVVLRLRLRRPEPGRRRHAQHLQPAVPVRPLLLRLAPTRSAGRTSRTSTASCRCTRPSGSPAWRSTTSSGWTARKDALYNAGGQRHPPRPDRPGRHRRRRGLDLVVNFHLDNHQDIFIRLLLTCSPATSSRRRATRAT